MRRWTKQERTAIETVARHFGGTWEGSTGASDGHLTMGGQGIAVSAATLRTRIRERPPRLRFDRVVLSLAERLKAALKDAVPGGSAALITVTAPIRQPAATAEALEEGVRALLRQRPARRDEAATIHGNETRILITKGLPAGAARVAVFVHNPGPGAADCVLEIAQALIKGLAAGGEPDGAAGRRWLVLASEEEARHAGLYRQVLTELAPNCGFEKAVMATADQRIEVLTGEARS